MPLQSRDTGSPALGSYGTPEDGWDNMHLYTTQVYEKWPGDVESFTQNTLKKSIARNFNMQLDFDNGGPFTGSVRGIRDTAHQSNVETDTNISDSDGACGRTCLNDGVPDDALPPGTFIYPGGNRVFNANGIPQNTIPIIARFPQPQHRHRPAADARDRVRRSQRLDDEDAGIGRRLRTAESAITALRFDGHYDFGGNFQSRFWRAQQSIATPTTSASRWSRRCGPGRAPAIRTDAWCATSAPTWCWVASD